LSSWNARKSLGIRTVVSDCAIRFINDNSPIGKEAAQNPGILDDTRDPAVLEIPDTDPIINESRCDPASGRVDRNLGNGDRIGNGLKWRTFATDRLGEDGPFETSQVFYPFMRYLSAQGRAGAAEVSRSYCELGDSNVGAVEGPSALTIGALEDFGAPDEQGGGEACYDRQRGCHEQDGAGSLAEFLVKDHRPAGLDKFQIACEGFDREMAFVGVRIAGLENDAVDFAE